MRMINFKNINKLYGINHNKNGVNNMSKEKTKNIINVASKQEQTTLVNDIVISNAETGHKKMVLTTMIINTIISGKVELKYNDKKDS